LKDDTYETLRHTTDRIEDSAIGPDRQITDMLLNRSLEKVIEGHLAILTGLLMVIAALTLVVGALGLASSISISVIERFREIAVLKAMGGRGSSIGALFVTEGVVIAVVGWAMSVVWAPLLSRPLVAALGSAVIGYEFEYRTSPGGVMLALGVALAVALVATILPIRAAMRLTIQRRLRSA
jgi:putative ABC transport system permease protein